MSLYKILAVLLCFCCEVRSAETSLYLSSKEDIAQKFIERIQGERERVCLATKRLAHGGILEALIDAHRRNVLVEIIVDSTSVSGNSSLHRLIKEGIAVWVWRSPELPRLKRGSQRMNHSFCLFGSTFSWTGSYGFGMKSKIAHLESALLFKDEQVVKELLDEFEKMKGKHSIYFPLYLQQKEVNS